MRNFEYASPTTEAEVLEHLLDWPDETELIAGGTDLVGLMQKMVITPKRVVNLLDVPSFRDVEELLLERGVIVTYEAIRKWCRKFGQAYANQLRRRRQAQCACGLCDREPHLEDELSPRAGQEGTALSARLGHCRESN